MTAAIGEFVDRNTFRFEFHYQHEPEAVWDAITDTKQLSHWFMPMRIEPRVGGQVSQVWQRCNHTGSGHSHGFRYARLLEYRFEKGAWDWPAGVLRFELALDPEGCRLIFTQSIAPDTIWSVDVEGQVAGPGTLHPEGMCRLAALL